MDLQKITDEKLVKEVRNGNNEIYSELVKRYQDKLLRYIHRLSNNSNDSEDILQNVFLKAYKNLYGFDLRKKFSSWIYRIAHNETINNIKKYSKEKQILMEIDYKIASNINLQEELELKNLKKDLNSYINSLPLKYREPIILYYFEGQSYEEISDILKIPVSSVGTLIHRGKKKIKKILKQPNNIKVSLNKK